jgi:hypothetical protein
VDGAVGAEEERRGALAEAGHGVLHEAQRPRVAPALEARERLVDLGAHGGVAAAPAPRRRRPAGGVGRRRSRVWCGGSLLFSHRAAE